MAPQHSADDQTYKQCRRSNIQTV